MKKMLLVVLGTLLLVPQIASALFFNGGFENGNYNSWTVEHAYNEAGLTISGGIPVAENVVKDDFVTPGWSPGAWPSSDLDFYTGDNRAVITSGTGFDPIATLLPVVEYGSYSARVNSRDGNNHATRIWQEAALTEADRDPTDNNFYLRFAWAAVLENPGHQPANQPYFHITITNITDNNTVIYNNFNFSNQPNLTWRTDNIAVGGWLWVPWQEENITLQDNTVTLASVGDILRIELSVGDCSFGGHGGYAFLDGFRSQASTTQTDTESTGFDLRRDGLGDGMNILNCGTVFDMDGKGGPGSGPWSGAALFTLYFVLFLLPVWILKRLHGTKRSFARPALLSLLVVLALLLTAALPAGAGELVAKAQRFHPTSDGFGTLTLDSDQVLGNGDWAFVSTLNYASRPLNLGDTRNLIVQRDRVRDLVTLDFAGAYGFGRNLSFGIDVPINMLLEGRNSVGANGTSYGIGDVRLNGKWQFLSRPDYGLAFVPFFNIPMGNKEFLLTEDRYGWGGKLAGHWAQSERLTLLANLGVELISSPFKSRIFSSWLQYGIGMDYKLATKGASIVAEINGETTLDKVWDHTVVSPFELLAAYRKNWTPGWTYEVGAGLGLNKGMGAPAYRALVGVSYLFGAPKTAPASTPPPAPMAMETPAAKPSPPPPAAAKPVKETITLKVEFDTDKADIKAKYNDDIARVAAYLKKYPDTTVAIEGHTDSTDGDKWNQKLSQMRADSVKNYLVAKFGVDASRISTKGYGASKPIADNKTKEGRQKNRRIEAIFR